MNRLPNRLQLSLPPALATTVGSFLTVADMAGFVALLPSPMAGLLQDWPGNLNLWQAYYVDGCMTLGFTLGPQNVNSLLWPALRRLRVLDVDGLRCRVDQVVSQLKPLRFLHSLHITSAHATLTDAGLADIGQLVSLRRLHLQDFPHPPPTRITSLAPLHQLLLLEHLDLAFWQTPLFRSLYALVVSARTHTHT